MSDNGINALLLALMILLPLSSLAARRLPLSTTLRMALAWVAIFGVALIAVTAATRAGFTRQGALEALGLADQSVVGATVRIPKAADGHFWTTVSINGVGRRMMIDSGATTIAISPEIARAAGIDTDGDLAGTLLSTANGTVIARRGVAHALSVGPIHARDLEVVVADSLGDGGLIGMNFLSQLKSWRVEGDEMILEPRKQGASAP